MTTGVGVKKMLQKKIGSLLVRISLRLELGLFGLSFFLTPKNEVDTLFRVPEFV